ncbi:TetR/AcrR family transcriptional regulator [Rossellomorea marisflavi]|uniref:TetR/AcrR family transcriptional regulator n=1 Tax=Rossellomorea marisflavi TaxID=189381 RepID=UPI00279835EA|nr:TetR/AcrR family transcriptional regulator [Rossellomorea marisflavi]UTE73730.1 TetR/AcrR family transcriptional regulator [Rossellomorea marisflavi]
MSSSLREKKLAKKKADILRAASSIIAEKGYERTTMEEVAAQLLMTKGSMYYYFKSKEDLLFECHMMVVEPSIEMIKRIRESDLPTEEKIRAHMKEYILFQISEKAMFTVAGKLDQTFSETYLEQILKKRDEYNQIFDELIEEGVDKGVYRKLDVKMARIMILSALNSIQLWYKPNGGRTPEQVAEIHADYLVRILM